MNPKQFVIKSVKTLEDFKLGLLFADGERFVLDIAPLAAGNSTLSRLNSPSVFRTAEVGESGSSVIWNRDDDLELAADNLRARAIEQAGGISHEFIWNWMGKYEMSLDDAAQALGLSRRMIAYYRSGEKPVPKSIALACIGFDDALRSGAWQFALVA